MEALGSRLMATLEGKVAVVTGPSRGIGAEVARALVMTAEDVAETVLFVLTRPRNHRILETAFRPMIEPSWG
jgi:3-oxoacyl-[acyl-carrier protein] reductase